MINMELVKKLKELEKNILNYRTLSKVDFDEEVTEEDRRAALSDVSRFEYSYRSEIMELTDEDKQELYKLAEENNVHLRFLFELSFTEEEKVRVREAKEWLHEPQPWEADLMKFLGEEESNKKKDKS